MRFYDLQCKIFVIVLVIVANISIIVYLKSSSQGELNLLEHTSCTSALPDIKLIKLERKEASSCDTIHLGFICGGYNSTRGLYTLLKSILFYRTNSKIKLHIFVDNDSEKVLRQMFSTWTVPDLDVNYYQMAQYEHQISWIPNEHYSQSYGLLKLVAPSVLANKGIEKIIFLDTDVLVLGDIAQLASEFSKLDDAHEETFIGLVENQSEWYQSDSTQAEGNRNRPIPWRARQRGFNTGVMLIDLVKLKTNHWDKMWRRVAETELISYLKTTLADQDIVNAVINMHSRIYIKLDCRYNIQLNDKTDLDTTCPSHKWTTSAAESFRLIHWNSPNKFESRNRYTEMYMIWYETFTNFNARLLDRGACSSRVPSNREILNTKLSKKHLLESRVHNDCHDIRPRPDERLRTYIYFLDFQVNELEGQADDQADVTLAVHLSIDRIKALDELASNWRGYISAAIYLSETEITLFTEAVQDAETLSRRKNIGYHLAFRDYGLNYPINRLRNLALNQTITSFVYITDVDFLPAYNLYDYLKSAIRQAQTHPGGDVSKTAFVVPVFETKEYRFDFPRAKSDLISQLDMGTITKFRDTIWPQGQAATQYDTWKQATKLYMIRWEPDYEPFIVVQTSSVPRFDERFTGFGWNKVQHIMVLAALEYKFYVLPEAFAIHQYHAASYDISLHRRSRKYQSCIRNLKELFLSELKSAHPNFFDRPIHEEISNGTFA